MIKKIMCVFGTRPEAIKMAPLVHALRAEPMYFDVKVCVTAQHRQMLDQVLNIFDIVPDFDLDVMRPGQDLFDLTADVMQGMRKVFADQKPDIVLVHGDTTTTFSTALAGFYAGVSIGHIEAGLRTYDIYAPFPEEFNRQVVTKLSKWHFAPTELARKNLINERVEYSNITVTGNTVIDALHWVINRIDNDNLLSTKLAYFFNQKLPFNWRSGNFILITGHRRENFGEGFLQICEALKELALKFTDVNFVYPMHLNPNVQKPVLSILTGLPNVHLIEPLEYEQFVYLLRYCLLVLTDSGGIQEEAPSLGKPVLVMRDITERPEAVHAGTVELVGANKNKIFHGVSKLLEDKEHYLKMSLAHNPYGDGSACEKILEVLRNV